VVLSVHRQQERPCVLAAHDVLRRRIVLVYIKNINVCTTPRRRSPTHPGVPWAGKRRAIPCAVHAAQNDCSGAIPRLALNILSICTMMQIRNDDA
jgi:hypothetical protein